MGGIGNRESDFYLQFTKYPTLFTKMPYWLYFQGPVNVCPKAHIKFSIFRNIFSKIEKTVILFQFSRKFFPKMEINVCPKGTHQ